MEETVEGITHFQGANVWEMTLAGSVVNTANISKVDPTVVRMSNEPTGVAWNPADGHFFFTDDNAKEVYNLDPGTDELVGTADDTWTSFDTLGEGSGDPEGIAFDSWRYDRLFVADGTNMEVYEFTLAGSLVNHFDVEGFGVGDPESVEFNPDTGTLFVLNRPRSSPVAIETTTWGARLRTIDVAAAKARNPAGLAYAPASDGSGAKRFYIVARGVDNNTDPEIIDGKMYEMTAPPPLTSDNTPPMADHDAHTTNEDTPLSVPAPGVLGNDTDADGHTLTAVLLLDVSHGTLTLNADGAFTYEPNENFFGTDSFSYVANDAEFDSNVAMVTITINPVNDAPSGNNDSGTGFTTDEDTAFTTGNVLTNDTDVENDTLSVSAFDTTGTIGQVTNNGDGTFGYDPNGQFEYLAPGQSTTDSFAYTVSDGNGGSDTATVTITVNGVNDAPVITGISPGEQTVDYSDQIAAVTITATDIDSNPLTLFLSGAPSALSLSAASCVAAGVNGSTCSWTLSGQVLVAAGSNTVTFTANDGLADSGSASHTLTVLAEAATVSFDSHNPVAVRVAEDGGNSGPFSLTVYVRETQPDEPAGSSAPGNIGLANVSMSLEPVGPGGSGSGACAPGPVDGSGYDAILPVTCSFDGVKVNAYTAQVTVGGGYYTGGAEDVLTVYDPSLGFATGGGWFYWPGTGERTNFGFTMKYNKKGQNVKGNLLLIRHLPDGSIYRVKSNALDGLALGESPDPTFGWASFSGKSTYLEPGWPEPQGNYEFLVYVEDRDEPGTGVDRFWIEVKDKDREVVPAMSMAREATDNAVELNGGNIAVPHGAGGGGKK